MCEYEEDSDASVDLADSQRHKHGGGLFGAVAVCAP